MRALAGVFFGQIPLLDDLIAETRNEHNLAQLLAALTTWKPRWLSAWEHNHKERKNDLPRCTCGLSACSSSSQSQEVIDYHYLRQFSFYARCTVS